MGIQHSILNCACGLAILSLTACAGYPRPAGTQVASKHCETSIGSLLCNNGDDQPTAGMNSAAVNRPFYQPGGGPGHK